MCLPTVKHTSRHPLRAVEKVKTARAKEVMGLDDARGKTF